MQKPDRRTDNSCRAVLVVNTKMQPSFSYTAYGTNGTFIFFCSVSNGLFPLPLKHGMSGVIVAAVQLLLQL